MPKVEQNGMPTSLHYALTDSQCSVCGRQLEWNANFDDINQPKYTSQHCNQSYDIRIDTVKVEIVTPNAGKEGLKDEPRAIKMAGAKKQQQQQQQAGQSKQQP